MAVKIAFALVLALVMAPAVVGSAAAGVALALGDALAPPLFVWVPAGGFPNAFPFGECTWWAAQNRRVTWGGHAGEWLANARAQGIPTSSEPEVGAIVVYRHGGDYSPLGHVALVIARSGDAYTVSEMNAVGHGRISTRVIAWPDPQVQGFIPVGDDELPRAGSGRPAIR